MTRRPSLAAVAKSRGCEPPAIRRLVNGEWRVVCHPAFDAMYVRTRKCATEALRAALLALPEKRKDGKR